MMQSKLRLALTAFLAILLFTTLFGEQQAELIIGGDFHYRPYEYLEDNIPKGYNVELSREVCKLLNRTPRFRLAKWSQVMNWLEEGEVDVVQGMALSAKRAKQFHFSQPHTQTWRSIFTHKNSGIKKFQDIRNGRLLMQKDDIAHEYLAQIGFTGTVIDVITMEDAIKLVNEGKYDAAITNYICGREVIERFKLDNIVVLAEQIQTRDYCFASKDKELILAIDQALDTLKENGTLQQLHNKWLGKYLYHPPHAGWDLSLGMAFLILMVFLTACLILINIILRQRKKMRSLHTGLKAQQARAEELAWYRKLIEAGSIIIYKLQIDPLAILYVSSNVSQWGLNPEEIYAHPEVPFMVTPEYQELGQSRLQRIQEERPATDELEYQIELPNGQTCWVYDFCLALPPEGAKQAYLGFLVDITQYREVEEELLEAREKAENASLAKGMFLAQMSHEIRTPLNGILGLINVLKGMELDPEVTEISELLYTSGQSLHKMVSDVLDLSKIEAGKLELISLEFSLQHLINDVVRSYATQNKNTVVDIRARLGDNLPDSLYGDMHRLRQIFLNLLDNAIKFTSEGWVELAAEVYTLAENEIRLIFSVEDTGIGIDHRKINAIFDQYGQADKLTAVHYGGTGLGLTIVKRLVEMMNGFIWLESEAEKGSKFYFIIPFRLEKPPEAQE